MVLNNRFFFIFILSVAGLCFSACNPRELPIIKGKLKEAEDASTKATDEVIQATPELKDLDNSCKQIPLPDSFKFVSKSMATHGPDTLYYHYYSNDDFNKTDNFFKEYFTGNGWQAVKYSSLNRTSAFQRENIKIIIQYGGMGSDVNYGITCGKVQ